MSDPVVVLPEALRAELVARIRERFPIKSFGYLIAREDSYRPDSFLIFEGNERNSREWKDRFLSYGQYFHDNDDAGFVASPEESWAMQKRMWALGMHPVGVFHSHQRHPANFSTVDYDLHVHAFEHLWHMIVSCRNPEQIEVRAFSTEAGRVRELDVVSDAQPAPACASVLPANVLEADRDGRPTCTDRHALWQALTPATARPSWLCGAEERYATHVAAGMQALPGAPFRMGSAFADAPRFVGETPVRPVELAPFLLGRLPVTNALYGLFDPRWAALDPALPAVDVSWYDAAVFAAWMGCRLPTEAEWEYGCAGSDAEAQWSCGSQADLARHAWYSHNAAGRLHPAGALAPNAFGLYDMHGNTWEWCADAWDQDSYAGTPAQGVYGHHRVSRGGSFHALAEMCRSRYRFHDPPEMTAWDLSFRLARDQAHDQEASPSSPSPYPAH